MKTLRLSLSAMPPALAQPAGDADRYQRRDAQNSWRGWYKTARWQRLVKRIRARDKLVCQQTGKLLVGRYPAPNSPVVDHKRPHRGDPDLFWDEANLQLVSKEYHDRVKQSLEKRGLA